MAFSFHAQRAQCLPLFAPRPPTLCTKMSACHAGCWPAAERSLTATEAFGRFKGPESGPSVSGTSAVAGRACQSMMAPPIPTVLGISALAICVQALCFINISMRRNCWPSPKPPHPVLGKGTILARYVPPWLRSTTTSSCPYDGVVLLWTSFDRAPSASPLQEEGGRVALCRAGSAPQLNALRRDGSME